MDNAGYIALTRQSGLLREMQVIANNVANMSTTGYQREGVEFSEYVRALPVAGHSISMATAGAHFTDERQGALTRTGGDLDLAIDGPGFFKVAAPGGDRLTRAGAFALSPEGQVVTPDGLNVLDEGGAPLFIPPDAHAVKIAADGTLSAGGAPLGKVGVFDAPPETLVREGAALYRATGEITPVETPVIAQGFLESSNVNPVAEISRMIEVQRTYELGQKFLDREDNRISRTIQIFGQQA